jgi:hypothetical protein
MLFNQMLLHCFSVENLASSATHRTKINIILSVNSVLLLLGLLKLKNSPQRQMSKGETAYNCIPGSDEMKMFQRTLAKCVLHVALSLKWREEQFVFSKHTHTDEAQPDRQMRESRGLSEKAVAAAVGDGGTTPPKERERAKARFV